MRKWFVFHTGGNSGRKESREDNSARLLKIYQGIGSVDECRMAVERMRPRRVVLKAGEYHCPQCGGWLYNEFHCRQCGQNLIWPEEEEL